MTVCKCRETARFHGRTAQEYASQHLVEIKDKPEKWETLFQCPITHIFWKEYYPYPEAQGGGPPELIRLTSEEARKEFGMMDDQS